jgi:hypothetical protein
LSDARTIATLQAALDLTQQRIRDLESANATTAVRVAEANARADEAERQLELAARSFGK